MIIHNGFIAFHIKRNGRRDNNIAPMVKAATMPYANGVFAKNMATTKIVVPIIFARGSIRCNNELPGKNWPIVILFNMLTSF